MTHQRARRTPPKVANVDDRTRWTPSLGSLALGAAFLYALTAPLLSGDLGWHLRVGEYVLDRHAVPHLNFLSFTAPWHPWLTHEWLSGVLLALVDRMGGLPALFLVRGALFTATLWVLYRLGLDEGAEPLTLAAMLFFAAVTLALHVALRPWLFSNLLLAVEMSILIAIDRGRRPRTWWWGFPLLFALWINIHGAYAVGVTLFLLTLARWVVAPTPGRRSQGGPGHRAWRAAGPAMASLVAMVPNPHGLEALILPFNYLLGDSVTGIAGLNAIKEWTPLPLTGFFGWVYICWGVLTAATVFLSKTARRAPETWMGILFLALTLNARRHLPVAALLLFPGVARGLLQPLKDWLSERTSTPGRFVAGLSAMESHPRGPFLATILAATAVGYLAWSVRPDFEADAMAAKRYPLATVEKMATLPPRRLFNHYDWAGLIAWKAPDWPLFITPVSDATPRAVLEDWLAIANLKPGWRDTLEAYHVEAVCMPPAAALVQALEQDPQWVSTLTSPRAVLLERKDSSN